MNEIYLMTFGIVLFQMLIVQPVLKKLFKIEK